MLNFHFRSASLVYVASAIAAAALFHLLLRASDHAGRRRLCEPGLLVFAGVLAIIILMAAGLAALRQIAPDLEYGVSGAFILDLKIGRLLPRTHARQGATSVTEEINEDFW